MQFRQLLFDLLRRPPHGGRGLKSSPADISSLQNEVVPHTGDVD